MRTNDVIIVGAGPAGSALAIHLARAGVDALLVDKKRFPRDKVCGELLNPRAIRSLAELGCLDEIQARGHARVRRCSVVLDGEVASSGVLPKVEGCDDYAHFVPRFELDEIIFRRAQQAGARTLEECQVVDFSVDSGGVTVAALDGDEGPISLRGRVLVGADGAESTVARSAGLAMQDERYTGVAMRSYGEGYPFEEALLFFDRDFFPGLGWAFPLKDGRFNLGVGMMSETIKRHRVRLKEFYERIAAFLCRQAAAEGWQARPGVPQGWALKNYGGVGANYFEGGLLIGDAGCFADPLTGEGIPVALETAEMAARTLQRAVAADDFSAASLADYERRFRERYDVDCSVADLIHTVCRNPHYADFFMTALRAMNETGNRDERYALKAAGIYCGIVAMREALEPEFFMSPLVQWPQIWSQVLGISDERSVSDLARRAADGLSWSLAAWRGMLEDPEWSRDWWLEVSSKQLRLLQTLAGASLRRS